MALENTKHYVQLRGKGEQIEFDFMYTSNNFPVLKKISESAKKLPYAGSLTSALIAAKLVENKSLAYFPSANHTNYWTGTVIESESGLVGVLIPLAKEFYSQPQPASEMTLTSAPRLSGKPEPFAALALVRGNVTKENIEDALNKIDVAIKSYKYPVQISSNIKRIKWEIYPPLFVISLK